MYGGFCRKSHLLCMGDFVESLIYFVWGILSKVSFKMYGGFCRKSHLFCMGDFAEAKRPLESRVDFLARVGHHCGAHLRQLGLVHAARQAPLLHEIHPQIQHQSRKKNNLAYPFLRPIFSSLLCPKISFTPWYLFIQLGFGNIDEFVNIGEFVNIDSSVGHSCQLW